MTERKKRILQRIEQKARLRMAQLANSYLHVPPEQREQVHAGIEIERWLAETCRECLE
jgi:hypothetical protein